MLAAIEERLDPNVVCEAVEIMDDKIHDAILAFDAQKIPELALYKALKIRNEVFEDLPVPWLKQLVTDYFVFKYREREKCNAPHHADAFQGRGR